MTILENTKSDSCIYCIMNQENGLFYIGQTRCYSKRSKEHLNDFKAGRHKNIWMQRVFQKNNLLIMFPVENCSPEKLNEREVFWIDYHQCSNRRNGYNLSKGGDFSLLLLTEDAQKRKADARRGKPGTLKGKKQSKEWIEARMSKLRGQKRNYSEEHLTAIRESRKKTKGIRKKGKLVKVIDLITKEEKIFQSKREVEDFLGIARDKLIHKFYKGKPRKILKETKVGKYLIIR